MNQPRSQNPIAIPRGGSLRIDDGAGVTLYVNRGELWLTEEGGGEDHLLQPGQQFHISRDGMTLALAFRESVVSVSAARPEHPAQGIGQVLRRTWASLFAPWARPNKPTFRTTRNRMQNPILPADTAR